MNTLLSNVDTTLVDWYVISVPKIMAVGTLFAVICAAGFFVSLIRDNLKQRKARKA